MTEAKYYIGHSSDQGIRYKSSSGGIGTTVIKYLLSTDDYDMALSFRFNKEKCAYESSFVHSFDDYNNCGSIYQDTDTIGYIKKNVDKIKRGLIVTCMPCQVKVIRNILKTHNLNSFIISLCCSGQTTVEGTWYYYKCLGIDKASVVNMQYRGNGWPSGIQIFMEDGKVIRRNNWTYPWTMMYQSLLFRPRRCLCCTFKTVPFSDINLADPWLDEYKTDTIGNSVVIANTIEGCDVIGKLKAENLIVCNDVDEATYIRSQKGTIEAKKQEKNHQKFIKLIIWMSSSTLYRNLVLSNPWLLKRHNRLIQKLHMYL